MNPFAFGVMSCRLPESLKLPGVIELGETRANRGSLVIGHGFWSFCTTDNAKRSTTTNFSSYTPGCPDAGAVWCFQYGYDVYGNRSIAQRAGSGSGVALNEPGGYTAATNRIAGGTWAYDELGNIKQDGSGAGMAWDAENRMVDYCAGVGTGCGDTTAGAVRYAYDGDGHRTKTVIGGLTTTYVYDAFDNLAAEYGAQGATTGLQFSVQDHLGTTRAVMDASGAVLERVDYHPFGAEIPAESGSWRTQIAGYGLSTPTTRLRFTGKERDAETGLDYFGARYFSGAQGRWTSPDAINLTDERVLNPSNTLNKYVYAGNNPLKYTDPDGRDITVFYTETGSAGHFWMAAYNQANRQSAIMDFGPANGASQTQMALGWDVPGDTKYASHMISVDEVKRDFASITIQTNPEETQKAITAINSTNAAQPAYNVYGSNCTTVCRDVLKKILGVNTNSVRPAAFWSDIFSDWSKQAQRPRQTTSRGSSGTQVQSTPGVDYGNPRYGMNTFDFVWSLLQQQGQRGTVNSRICFTDENGKQVCQ